MTSLFEQWSPVTRDLGLIRCSLDQVVEAHLAWAGEHDLKLERTMVQGSLGEKLKALLPLCNAKTRSLYLPTETGWTVFLQNGIQGSDPAFNMMQLSLRLDVLAMRVCVTPPEARYRGVIWEVFGSEALGGTRFGRRRSIAALNDGGRWVFEESGTRYPFERTERYEAKRKRDRFTAEMLADYLSHFGLPEPGDGLLGPAVHHPAVLLERENASGLPEFSLEEVKKGVPWDG